jgi:hypothetical protein
MKKETEELIKLISTADDPNKAALAAFAILMDYLGEKKEDNPVQLLVNCQGAPT